ncbi:MAG: heparinase II/III family protein [Sphingomonadaceae bacterium]
MSIAQEALPHGDAPDHGRIDGRGTAQPALPLAGARVEPLAVPSPKAPTPTEPPAEPSRALVPSDFRPPSGNALNRAIVWAYRLGVPCAVLAAPLRKPQGLRLLGTVETPLQGDRAHGTALRAGHFLIHGARVPIGEMDFGSSTRTPVPFQQVVHGFGWLRDLASSAARPQCTATAERILQRWLDLNPTPAKGPAWTVEHTGKRLLAWLVHAPLILSNEDKRDRRRILATMEETARWLDRQMGSAEDKLAALAGWCAITAAGILLPDGKPRRLFGESGLVKTLGELVSEDGGTLSRSPLAQMDAIALLVDLKACYDAVGRSPPRAIDAMLGLLVPPLLALRHGDGGLGSWQGAGAVPAHRLAAVIEASGIRTRPARDTRHWGYQQVSAGRSTLQVDTAPPPRPRDARFGCASTLAMEFSSGTQRLIVNCGGAAWAGGQVPLRIEQGLRASAAHSTLTLDDANSTAILIKGQIGKGVDTVDVTRKTVEVGGRPATRIDASHDGYVSRFGLLHRRILLLSADGEELRGEDVLEPYAKRGKRGKIGFAIRFHIGPGIEIGLAEDGRGAGLALPDGSYWQMRLGGDNADAQLTLEESLWVDGEGRPQPTQQLVIEGLTSRGGGSFPWLLKKMG